MALHALHEGRWLKKQIASAGTSQSAFARSIGVPVQSLTRWFRQPVLKMRGDNLGKVASGLGVTIDELDARLALARRDAERQESETDEQRKSRIEAVGTVRASIVSEMRRAGLPVGEDAELPSLAQRAGIEDKMERIAGWPGAAAAREIPLFELSVAAGPWTDVSEAWEGSGPQGAGDGPFRVRLAGDSMSPVYKSGDIVEFRPLLPGEEPVALGDYLVQIEGGLATFKSLEKVSESELVLRALNRARYRAPVVVQRKKVVMLARAVAKVTLIG